MRGSVPGGPGVPGHLGGLAPVALAAPSPDVLPHAPPHETIRDSASSGPGAWVAEGMDGVKDLPGDARGDDGMHPAGAGVAP